MPWIEPVTLSNDYCTLEPLQRRHHHALIVATQNGDVWKTQHTLVPAPQNMSKEIDRRLALQTNGLMIPFVVIHNQTQQIAGMTTYCQIDSVNKRLDIGFTWYAKSHQRTPLNTQCKLLLLNHAFEKLDCIAVGFRVDFLNQVSRRAVERLGAKFEGLIRNYAVMPDGNIRDMCLYSILPYEWPRVKAHLSGLLSNSEGSQSRLLLHKNQ